MSVVIEKSLWLNLDLFDCIYFYCAIGYGKAKFNLNYFERKLMVNATARNYKTMLKLISMAEESESNL